MKHYRTRYNVTFSSTFPWIVARAAIASAGAFAFYFAVQVATR